MYCGPTSKVLKTRSPSGWNFFYFFFNEKILVHLYASVERFCVSRMLDFYTRIFVRPLSALHACMMYCSQY